MSRCNIEDKPGLAYVDNHIKRNGTAQRAKVDYKKIFLTMKRRLLDMDPGELTLPCGYVLCSNPVRSTPLENITADKITFYTPTRDNRLPLHFLCNSRPD